MGASSDVAQRRSDSLGGIGALWAGILAGPAAWAGDLTISYSLVKWTCGGGPPVVLHLITLFALAIIGGGAWSAWRALQLAPPPAPLDGGSPDQRGRFMAWLGLAMCALFATAVVAAAIPRLVLDACQQ